MPSVPEEESKHPWEVGVDMEEVRRARKIREDKERVERHNQIKRDKDMNVVSNFNRLWFPPLFEEPIIHVLRSRLPDMERDYLAWAVLTVEVIGYVLVAFIVGKISHLLVFFMHVGLSFYFEERGIFMAFAVYWVLNKGCRIFTRPKEYRIYEELHYATPREGPYVKTYEPLIYLAVLLGVSYLLHGTSFGSTFGSVWILVVVIVMSKMVPGVGGNSTMGLVTFVIVLVLGLATVPEIWSSLLLVTRRAMAPAEVVTGPPEWYGGVASWATSLPVIGYTYSTLWDVLRKMCCYVPLIWIAIDDIRGPGLGISKAWETHAKKDSLLGHGTAALYKGAGWLPVVVECVLLWWRGSMVEIVILWIVAVLTWLAWDVFGRSEWIGRGAGMTVTTVRPGWRTVFGHGPEGLRVMVLQVSTLAAWLILFISTMSQVSMLGVAFLLTVLNKERAVALILGIGTLSPVWLWRAWKSDKPMTESLNQNSVDAHPPGAEYIE
nr:VP3 [Jingmenvirus sp.]